MKILKRLAQGGIYSNKVMAKELDIDESLVQQMILQLQRLGYIEKEKMEHCSSECNCCDSSKKGCCGIHNIDINIWKITNKGQEVIKQHQYYCSIVDKVFESKN